MKDNEDNFMALKDFDVEILYAEEVKPLTKGVLPEVDLLDFYNRQSRRHIFLNDIIDDGLVEYSYQIIQWNLEDKGKSQEERIPIKIFVNSDGGSLNAVMNFINIIQLSKTKVITIGMGKCYSSGGLLLMSAKERLIFPDTSCLIHDGSTGAYGDTGKVIDNLEFTQKLEEKIKKYILSNTKIPNEQYEKNYRRDWWLFAEECIELGIADRIITDLDEIIG